MGDEKVPFWVLNGTNYSSWWTRLEADLGTKGLMHILDLDEKPTSETANKAKLKEYFTARGAIIKTLYEERIGMITSDMTPKFIVEEFKRRYEVTKSDLAVAMTLRELFHVKPEIGKMEEFFQKYESLYQQARRLGMPVIDDKWQVYWIIAIMPPELDFMFTRLTLKEASDFDMHKVKHHILTEEKRQFGSKLEKEPEPEAAAMFTNAKTFHGSNNNDQNRCWGCGKLGHYRKDCRNRQNGNGGGSAGRGGGGSTGRGGR